MLVGQVQDALRGAEPIQGVVFQQPADQRLQAGPISAAFFRHHAGVRIWNAIFSGG